MLKLMFALHRRPDLTHEQFVAYWREHHGPLVATHATTLRIRRYVQTVTGPSSSSMLLADARGSQVGAFDGVAELWFDDEHDLAAAVADRRGREAARALVDDERRFIDVARSSIWVAREHIVIDTSGA